MLSRARRLGFVVRGRVQGVAFRAYARDEARRLALTGFVMNRADAAVEGEVQGDSRAVEAFADWLRQGPPSARVDEVRIAELAVDDAEQSFVVRR